MFFGSYDCGDLGNDSESAVGSSSDHNNGDNI